MASAAGCFIGGDCAEAQRTIHAAAVTLSLAQSGWAGHHNYDLTVVVAACELERQLFVRFNAEPTDIEIQSREGCTADLVRSPLTRALLPVLKLVETPGCSAVGGCKVGFKFSRPLQADELFLLCPPISFLPACGSPPSPQQSPVPSPAPPIVPPLAPPCPRLPLPSPPPSPLAPQPFTPLPSLPLKDSHSLVTDIHSLATDSDSLAIGSLSRAIDSHSLLADSHALHPPVTLSLPASEHTLTLSLPAAPPPPSLVYALARVFFAVVALFGVVHVARLSCAPRRAPPHRLQLVRNTSDEEDAVLSDAPVWRTHIAGRSLADGGGVSKCSFARPPALSSFSLPRWEEDTRHEKTRHLPAANETLQLAAPAEGALNVREDKYPSPRDHEQTHLVASIPTTSRMTVADGMAGYQEEGAPLGSPPRISASQQPQRESIAQKWTRMPVLTMD